MGIDLGREYVPDGTTLLKFRRLLQKHNLGAQLFAQVGQILQARGLRVGAGSSTAPGLGLGALHAD